MLDSLKKKISCLISGKVLFSFGSFYLAVFFWCGEGFSFFENPNKPLKPVSKSDPASASGSGSGSDSDPDSGSCSDSDLDSGFGSGISPNRGLDTCATYDPFSKKSDTERKHSEMLFSN